MIQDIWDNVKSHSNIVVGFTLGLTAGLASRSSAVRQFCLFFRAGPMAFTNGPKKMVIVVRSDVSMSSGKIASQCAHAAVSCFYKSYESCPKEILSWISQGQPKIVLRGGPGGETYLTELHNKAVQNGMVVSLIRDAGRTEVRRGTCTVLGIGPAPVVAIDQITGHLKTL